MSQPNSDALALLSIIIPVYNEEEKIAEQVQYLKSCSQDYPTEYIVVDGGSTDQTIEKVQALGVECLVSNGKGRAEQMNVGANHSKGSILYFVHADTRPPDTFQEDIRQAIEAGNPSGCYRYQFDTNHLLLKINAYCTRFDRLMCRGGDQTLFITRELFNELNGFREDHKIMEDFEFIRRLRNKDAFSILPKNAIVSARKYRDNGYLKVNLVNLVVFMMFFYGASQETMLHAYQNLITNTKFG